MSLLDFTFDRQLIEPGHIQTSHLVVSSNEIHRFVHVDMAGKTAPVIPVRAKAATHSGFQQRAAHPMWVRCLARLKLIAQEHSCDARDDRRRKAGTALARG